MRSIILAFILLAASALTGCIGALDDAEDLDPTNTDDQPTFVPPAADTDLTDAIDPNHADHHLPQLHENSHRLEQVGYTNFAGFYPPDYNGGWGEVDVHDGRDLAAVASVNGKLGVTLVDISDPTSPTPLSYISSTGAEFDARFTDDGDYLVFGCQVSPPTLGGEPMVLGDCAGDTQPHAPNQEASHKTVFYDVSDPENPELAGIVDTNAAHNVFSTTINGTIYAFTNAVEIIEFDPTKPVEEAAEVVANVQGTHDASVHKHPITGDWLLYTGATEDSSLAIYEVNDPTNPQVVVNGGVEGAVAWHEQTVSPTVIDGRVLAIGAGETFSSTGDVGGDERQYASVIDVTDPTSPELLGTWQLPVDMQLPYANYRYSAHNIDITPHGQVAMAWYHGGIWVFDVSTQERQEDPATLGFYQPHELWSPVLPASFFQLDHAMVPVVWGGMWTEEGRLVLGDLYTGLYVLEPEWGLLPGATGGNATAAS